MSHGNADIGELTPRSRFYQQGRFGRLFPTLPPFAADTPLIRDALTELGAPNGPMDAQDDLTDPITLITDSGKSLHNPNNPTMTAGFTFFGQFLDHDMTFDPTSSLARRQDTTRTSLSASSNWRSCGSITSCWSTSPPSWERASPPMRSSRRRSGSCGGITSG